MKGFSKYTLWLCMMALLPLNATADIYNYGIFDGTTKTDVGDLEGTWNAAYQGGGSFFGDGTKSYPYRINDVWDLCRLEELVNDGNSFIGKYFKLMKDIDLKGKIWYPIGVKSDACFEGFFDGDGKTISNMSIVVKDADNTKTYSYGLFGHMKGVVRRLNMENGYIVIDRSTDNQASMLSAGLLCGTMSYDMDSKKNIYGTVYECNIKGSIGGSVSKYSEQAFVGGIAGMVYNPVSIYKCQADVEMTTTDIGYVGGIVGYSLPLNSYPNGRENTRDTPCMSYIFDCVANVNIKAELCLSNFLYCGGLCGLSSGTLLACVANGTIECGLHYTCEYQMNQVEMSMGGLTGNNVYNIVNCVSTAHLKGGKMVGGLTGENGAEGTGLWKGNVLNSVFCGHIDSPYADHTHGLVGSQSANANAPFNCLFVGTMNGGTNKAPLSNSTNAWANCYSDRNMYDDGKEWSCYKYTDELCAANNEWFKGKFDCNVPWLSVYYNKNYTNQISCSDYVFKGGFYPYFEVTSNNMACGVSTFCDYVIDIATTYFGDNTDNMRTPSLYNKYAWLGSVPMNVPNRGFTTDFVDMPVSLAIKQQPTEGSNMKTATFSVNDDKMTVGGETNAQTATPKDNIEGDVMLTITSDDNVSRQICLHINTLHQWDGTIGTYFDGGNGTEASPYLIHNARQLMKALTTNESDEYYRLTKDIWFHDNLLTDTGEPKEGAVAWNHGTNRNNNNWKAHLNGDSHLVHGLYSTNAFGLVEKIQNDASIENTCFVDCLVWSPEADPDNTETGYRRPFGFLTPSIGATAAVRNCLFSGVVKERRTNALHTDFCAFIHDIDNSEKQIGTNPIIEDCVLSIVAKSDIADRRPVHAFLAHKSGAYTTNLAARRVLVLNNSNAESYLTPSGINFEACHFPVGYMPYYAFDQETENGMLVSAMTDGTFFTGDGYDKWMAKKGYFPMLTSFAATEYGKLIALPVYTAADNRLTDMNYLLDFHPGAASWRTTNSDALDIDTDIRVIEPKTASTTAYVVRSMNDAKMIMPVTTAAEITRGIQFTDVEAKKFCLAHYDTNNDGAVSLSELKTVTLDKFQDDMNEDDGISYDNDGEMIERFPEFRYFAGVHGLGTSFQEKDKLQQLAFSGNIKALPDDAFKGTTSMTSFTIPVSITSFGAHPFYNSGLEGFEVDGDHTLFAADGGLLTNKDKTQLLCWPNGKKGFDIEVPVVDTQSSAPGRRRAANIKFNGVDIPANVTKIAANAIYKVPKVNAVFLKSADYDYKTVKELAEDAVKAADNVGVMRFYVNDGTNDPQTEWQDEETGEGNGHLLNFYKASSNWKGMTLDRYWELDVNSRSKDSQGRYWATMYIGFDTQLPEGLTAYIVDKEKTSTQESTLVLRKLGRKVPMMTPVVILAEKYGTFKLFPSKGAKYEEVGMSENLLDGVNRDGLKANQGDANDGSCLTLGLNKSGKVGFFIYKGKAKIPPFRAYISVNKVNNAQNMIISLDDDQTTGVGNMNKQQDDDLYYDIKGERVEQPRKGLYINNGKKIVIK